MTSRRNYLSLEELAEYADITIIDETEAYDQISQAEELIDSYVGFQTRFVPEVVQGLASAGGASTLTLETAHQNVYFTDYFKGCEIEILGGVGEGQRRRINSSTYAGVLTTTDAWTTAPTSTSFYKIYQLGKFPRLADGTLYSTNSVNTFYKQIPEAVKRAVAAQVEYLVNMGASFFSTDGANKKSESLGDYSFERSKTGSLALIAPKAKILLRGIVNIVGDII